MQRQPTYSKQFDYSADDVELKLDEAPGIALRRKEYLKHEWQTCVGPWRAYQLTLSLHIVMRYP
jgi:hypothetical protein